MWKIYYFIANNLKVWFQAKPSWMVVFASHPQPNMKIVARGRQYYYFQSENCLFSIEFFQHNPGKIFRIFLRMISCKNRWADFTRIRPYIHRGVGQYFSVYNCLCQDWMTIVSFWTKWRISYKDLGRTRGDPSLRSGWQYILGIIQSNSTLWDCLRVKAICLTMFI